MLLIPEQALQGNARGHPVQRAMFLEFPDDRTTHYLDRQYMLGPSLLVAPVFVPQGEELEYYIPAGRWTSFFHPERSIVGPVWVREVVPLDEIPVWVRPNTVLCLGPPGIGRPDYEFGKGLDVQVYELEDGRVSDMEIPKGIRKIIAGVVRVEGSGGEAKVSVQGDVDLRSVSLYTGGKAKTVEVAQGERTVSLNV